MHDKKNQIVLILLLLFGNLFFMPHGLASGGCTTAGCHRGISDIVPMTLGMMQLIKQTGQRHGDPDGCVICHGGNPDASKKKAAHSAVPRTLLRAAGPKDFYPDPGSLWIARNTCGVCHPGFVYRMERSLMNTEAGKIQGNLHTWGIESAKDHPVRFGNYDIKDTDGPVPMGSSAAYETYMADMRRQYPGQYPDHFLQLLLPDIKQIEKDPTLAGFTYQRQECQRCHIGVKGQKVRGDYRGMGCSACHMPYSNEGFYQGDDPSIPKDVPGHIFAHKIIGNRKTRGIPVETCNACHNRGKRIGVSYQGQMESSYKGPFDKNGNPRPELHGKTYQMLSGDLHHRFETSSTGTPEGGLLCQDCHTSQDVHGDGNLHGTTLAQVEIECTDCHGTPDRFPWELPLGHGDEFGRTVSAQTPRGVTDQKLLSDRQFGFDHDPRQGLLLTARGNPFGNVVKSDDGVLVYSATGNDFKVPQLKGIKEKKAWKTASARIAMSSVSAHLNRMECYTCHSSWAPQSYGCQIKVDYQNNSTEQIDWVASGNVQLKNGQTAESKKGSKGILSSATIEEHPAYLRWEDPVLGINGEGRISPLIPGCQVVFTVIGKNGKTLAHNQISDNAAEARSIGQASVPLGLDMAPAQPHTNQRNARSCENCHTHPKASGLGIEPACQNTGIEKLTFDWSRIVTRDGIQLATVGTHWPLSRALNKKELEGFLRTGTCMGCHSNMDNPQFWEKVSTKGTLDALKHSELMHQVLKNQVLPDQIQKID